MNQQKVNMKVCFCPQVDPRCTWSILSVPPLSTSKKMEDLLPSAELAPPKPKPLHHRPPAASPSKHTAVPPPSKRQLPAPLPAPLKRRPPPAFRGAFKPEPPSLAPPLPKHKFTAVKSSPRTCILIDPLPAPPKARRRGANPDPEPPAPAAPLKHKLPAPHPGPFQPEFLSPEHGPSRPKSFDDDAKRKKNIGGLLNIRQLC